MRVTHGNRGFCNVNMEAVMIENLRRRFGPLRVAIVDTDCHHGDGTQDIYWNDPDTLFISLHQDGRTLYPGTGFVPECGGPGALVLCTLFFPDQLDIAFPIALAIGNLVDPPATMVNAAGDYVVSFIVERFVSGKDWLQKKLAKDAANELEA